MIITKVNDQYVRYRPEGEKEKKLIRSFPGLLFLGLDYYSVAKPHVVANLVQRLQKKKFAIRADSSVKSYIEDTFKLKEIPEDFKFYTEPLPHQLLALRFAYTLGSCGLLLEAGMGKTKIVLDYIALSKFKKSLIIAPKALLFVWEDERIAHRPDKTIYVVKSTNWEEEQEGILAADIVVVNYTKAVLMKGGLSSITWDYINLDEFLVKDPFSQRSQAINEIGRGVANKTGSSGTLVNNSPMDTFNPVRFLEPSLTGESYIKFRDEYCVMVKGSRKDDGSYNKFIVGYRKVDEIKALLHSCSIVMTKEVWLKNLPKKVFRNVIVQMSDEQRHHYQELASNYITSLDGQYLEVENPLTVLCKLLQISNGFAYLDQGNEEEQEWLTGKESKKKKANRKTHFFKEQPKAEKLVSLLGNELSNRRVILWYNLSGERKVIEEYLTKAGISFITIAGGEKDTGNKVRTFNENNSCRVLLCQAKAVNYGITVLGHDGEDEDIPILPNIDTNVYTQIFYSLSFSLEVFLQQQDRIHRIGQTHECEYYILVSNSAIEYDIVEKIEFKTELRENILTDIMRSHEHSLFRQSLEEQVF